VREQDREIRRLSRELALAQRHERDQLARILHDEFQQLLFALKIRIDAVSGGASMGVHGEAIRDLVEQASVLTRTLVVSLAPPIYESDDLEAALEWLADYIGDRYGVKVEVACERPLACCDEERRVLLFEATRELLFNVVKHAGVDHAQVTVQQKAGGVRIVVADEGRGCNPATALRRRKKGGYGLPQLRRRLRLLGGELRLESAPGRGVRASAAVPL
jgi:signal transduction histidine kinase